MLSHALPASRVNRLIWDSPLPENRIGFAGDAQVLDTLVVQGSGFRLVEGRLRMEVRQVLGKGVLFLAESESVGQPRIGGGHRPVDDAVAVGVGEIEVVRIVLAGLAAEVNSARMGHRERVAAAAVGQEVQRGHLDYALRVSRQFAILDHAVGHLSAIVDQRQGADAPARGSRRVEAETHPAHLGESAGRCCSDAVGGDGVLDDFHQLPGRQWAR